MFNKKLTEAPDLVTFADLFLLPGKTETDPAYVDIAGNVTKKIKLSEPYVASPMDTVTGSNMAIGIARAGGVGVLHRNCSIENEVKMAKKVKKAESYIIADDIITITPNITVGEAKNIMNNRQISGLPVTEDEVVVGILTKRDVRFAADTAKVAEMMSTELVTAEKNVAIVEAKRLLHQHRIEKLLIVDSAKKLKGLITVKDLESSKKHPHATRDEDGKLVAGAAIGPFDEKRALALDPYVDFFVVDLAHGHNMNALRSAKKIAEKLSAEVIYGNLGSKKATADVVSVFEDVAGIRVGIGSGAICSTSVVTKASAPTLYSTIQVASALDEMGLDIPVIADGGINNPGSAALSFAGGASVIMMGSMFAGCRESPGQLLAVEGKMMKSYRGMGSRAAKAVRYALDRYSKPAKGIPEGVEGFVPFRGTVQDVIQDFSGGLKAAFGYAGAANIAEMHTSAKFGRISNQGITETTPHDIYPSSAPEPNSE